MAKAVDKNDLLRAGINNTSGRVVAGVFTLWTNDELKAGTLLREQKAQHVKDEQSKAAKADAAAFLKAQKTVEADAAEIASALVAAQTQAEADAAEIAALKEQLAAGKTD